MLWYPIFLLVKIVQAAVRRLGRGGGTALPGLMAERVSPGMLAGLAGQLEGAILVAGTNGKTTTSRLIASYLEGGPRQIVHNRSGSNLTRGILSALIEAADWRGRVGGKWGLFEVDEAVLPKLLSLFSPDYVVGLNLFRDQLDRYGEVDTIAHAWRLACRQLPATTTLLLNGDDPLMASLGTDTAATVVYFGVAYGDADRLPSYADSRRCPECGQALQFSRVSYSHLGDYRCPKGDFGRPTPDVVADKVTLKGMAGSTFALPGVVPGVLTFGLAGLYNVYNATAALAVGQQLGVTPGRLEARTRHFEAVFGRLEQIALGEVTLTLILVKNPTGFNQVLQTLSSDGETHDMWFILNDRFADGRDVSWIWDVDMEQLRERVRWLLVSGTRAEDMALRVKYAEIDMPRSRIQARLSEALRSLSGSGRRHVYCLCTYTAMMELRQLLQKQSGARLGLRS